MTADNQALLLQKISNILIGTRDFQRLARQAVDLIVKEFKEQNLRGAAIFRVHQQDNLLYAYDYSYKYRRVIDKLLPTKFSELNIPLTATDNLIVKTAVTNQIQQSKRIADFAHGVLADDLSDKLQRLMKVKLAITFPIRLKSGKVGGVLMFVVGQETMTGKQLVLFETFADQLGLAFSNVFAFEKVVAQYKNTLDRDLATSITKENIPSLKFTLRISPKQNKKLERLARETGKTKAEHLRELLDKI